MKTQKQASYNLAWSSTHIPASLTHFAALILCDLTTYSTLEVRTRVEISASPMLSLCHGSELLRSVFTYHKALIQHPLRQLTLSVLTPCNTLSTSDMCFYLSLLRWEPPAVWALERENTVHIDWLSWQTCSLCSVHRHRSQKKIFILSLVARRGRVSTEGLAPQSQSERGVFDSFFLFSLHLWCTSVDLDASE